HPAAGVRKAALQVLPATAANVAQIRSAGLMNDPDPHTRLAAILTLAQLPASDAVGAELYALGKTPAVDGDEWLSQAVYVAAAHHRGGYLKAYEADLDAAPFRALADRLAKEEATPPVRPMGGPGGRGQGAEPAPHVP